MSNSPNSKTYRLNNMLPFEHRDLNLHKTQIRLLRLEKNRDDATSIQLTPRHAILDQDLGFHALSMRGQRNTTLPSNDL